MRYIATSTPLARINDSQRDATLDFVKGTLVVVMVLYHTMNIFSVGEDQYIYVRFVSGSFIFVTGYIVAVFYAPRFLIDKATTTQRLLVRGFKLLMVFTILNVLANVSGFTNPTKVRLGVEAYFMNVGAIYGFGDGRLASFQILLPIAYVLLASPFFLLFASFGKSIFLVASVIAFVVSFIGVDLANLGFSLVGLMGLAAGMVTARTEYRSVHTNRFVLVGLLLVFVCLAGPLSVNTMTYALAIMAILKLLYDLAHTYSMKSKGSVVLVTLGNYSLVCYIAQIAFLHALSGALGRPRWDLGYQAALVFLVTNALLVALCVSLRLLRDKFRAVNVAYRLIFA